VMTQILMRPMALLIRDLRPEMTRWPRGARRGPT